MSSSTGELVTETFDYDGGRQVTAYVPPGPPEAVVFAGDGQLISRWGGTLAEAGVPSTMIVGVHRLDDEMLRLHEYSPGFDPDRFAAHERFSSMMSGGGRGRASALRCRRNGPRCSVSRLAASFRWRSGSGILTSTV